MKKAAGTMFKCPRCKGELRLSPSSQTPEAVKKGAFACGKCNKSYPVSEGIPDFLPDGTTPEVSQVIESYSEKWGYVPSLFDEDAPPTKMLIDYFLKRYRFGTEKKFAEFLSGKKLILDAGCGLGRDVRLFARLNPEAEVVGGDISTGVYIAAEKSKKYPNITLFRGDVLNFPFGDETFDLVSCDQVLPALSDPALAVERLSRLVKRKGHLLVYAYRKKGPIREFADDYLRAYISKLSPQEGIEVCRAITKLGKALSDLHVEFEIPEDIPHLQIKAGKYDVQRFFYYHVLKCYWNDAWTFEEANIVNFDWYHPAFTWRHTSAELVDMVEKAGLKVTHVDEEELSGVSVIAEKG